MQQTGVANPNTKPNPDHDLNLNPNCHKPAMVYV